MNPRRRLPAFRYEDGKLVSCEDMGPTMLLAPRVPFTIPRPRRLTKRERRHEARRHSGRHRYRARAVAAVGFPIEPYAPAPAPVRLNAHRFAGPDSSIVRAYGPFAPRMKIPDVEVLLYLPAGEKATAQHARDIERAMRSGR